MIDETKLIEKVERVAASVTTFEQTVCAKRYILLAQRLIREPSVMTRSESCMKRVHGRCMNLALAANRKKRVSK
jgi:hypothetical protein